MPKKAPPPTTKEGSPGAPDVPGPAKGTKAKGGKIKGQE